MTRPPHLTEIEHLQRQLAASRERIATLESRIRDLLAEVARLRDALIGRADPGDIHDD